MLAPPSLPQSLSEPAQDEPAALSYRARIPDTGDATLDALLRTTSNLIALQEVAPTDAEGLLSRIAAEPARLWPVLDAEGYWAGRIEITQSPGTPVAVEIGVTPGPRYTLRQITVEGSPAPDLTAGQPARAEAVLGAETALLAQLRRDGHPLARIERQVTVDHSARAMDIAFTVQPGPRAEFAPPSVTGTERVNPEVVRRVAALRLAEQSFSPERLARARADVAALGPFASVRIETGPALDAQGRLPVTVEVRERPFRVLSATAAYETNYGASLRFGWQHRNLLGGAENLRVELEASRIGTDPNLLNARAAVTWRQPLPFGWDGSLVGGPALVRDRLDSYDRNAFVFNLAYERRLGERWTLSTGPIAEIGQSGVPGGTLSPYQLAGWAVQARYDSTQSLLDPRSGIRAQGSVTPSYAFNDSTAYLPLRLAGSTYFDVTGDGRGILALRGVLGSLVNTTAENVPPSQRFYAGGGGSVRGYDYQSIGPRTPQGQPGGGKPAGGASLLEGTVEWRQRFGENFGAVAFVDAGSVGAKTWAPTDDLRVGAGIGLRYYTAIGPIRADLAIPLVRQQGSGSFGFYIGIGQAF
ncbi:autotransporter assembly complex family protein [Sediminicoccus sp. KRV36]|uniref:autotransporter assembly complex protein TamA n=1 Tax=Sediminicoccus sp. KRV36 TaxID=3133721 RepID=UPI00200D2CBB|nr:autotransporter assembly complex family protein [Sediminicoccus rosea]UPY39366.1 autotransporter assembly complex protein TamA [Sediminicoccus rosea]